MIKTFDRVVLLKDLPKTVSVLDLTKSGVKKGTVGSVVDISADKKTLTVEFFKNGETISVTSLPASLVQKASGSPYRKSKALTAKV
jgi:transcription elongation factor